MRIIQAFASRILSGQGHTAMRPCAQINSDGVLPAAAIRQLWPGCAAYLAGADPGRQVPVDADYHGFPIEINVALSIASGASALLALSLHAVAIEIYVSIYPGHHVYIRQGTDRRRSISEPKPLTANTKSCSSI